MTSDKELIFRGHHLGGLLMTTREGIDWIDRNVQALYDLLKDPPGINFQAYVMFDDYFGPEGAFFAEHCR